MRRYTFFFTMYQQGWSETFFRAAPFSSGEGALLDNYIQRRCEALSTQCFMVGVRSSDVDTKRDITVHQLPSEGKKGVWAQVDGSPTEPEDSFTALLLRLTDGAQNWRSFPMVGMPDHVFSGGIVTPSEQAMVTLRLNTWMSAITLAGFGMKAQGVPVSTGRIVQFPDKTPDNQLVCLGITGALPAVGSLITLGGVKPWNKLNRTWRVASTIPAAGADPAFIYLAGTQGLNSHGPVEGGTWKQPSFNLAVLNSYIISRMTSRKTGVPFTTVRGRR